MNKRGNDFNLSQSIPHAFCLLPETVNAYEQQHVWIEAELQESDRSETDEHFINYY